MLHLDWLSGRSKNYQLRQSNDAFEVIDDSISDLLKRVLSRLDFFLAFYWLPVTMLCVLTRDAVSPESETEWSPYLVTVHFSETDIDG